MIDPGIWQSEDFASLSIIARLTFIGMFSNADDEGRGRAKPVYIKSVIYPYDEDLRVSDIEKALSEISTKMSVTFYSNDGNEYYSLNNWTSWQRVDKPQASKIPTPESVENHSGISRESFSPNPEKTFSKGKEEKRKEDKLKEEKSVPLSDFEKVITDFKEFRKSVKAPMTDRAVELLLIDLQKLAPDDERRKIEILNQSILKNWKGVFQLKDDPKPKKYTTAADLPKAKSSTMQEAERLKKFMQSMEGEDD